MIVLDKFYTLAEFAIDKSLSIIPLQFLQGLKERYLYTCKYCKA